MRLAVTGHRPDKLGGYKTDVYRRLRQLAKRKIEELKPELVLTGMALGWDQAVADACVDLGVPFEACVPFNGQEKIWPDKSKLHYKELLMLAKEVIYVCEPVFAPWKMIRRNEYMVDNSDHLLALWNGTDGGTGKTCKYALKVGREITNCWEDWRNDG
jgi:uncharacterized phage-like protein YoqJ